MLHGEVREARRGTHAAANEVLQMDPAIDRLMHHLRLKLRKGGAFIMRNIAALLRVTH
jgi:hypothetical protein